MKKWTFIVAIAAVLTVLSSCGKKESVQPISKVEIGDYMLDKAGNAADQYVLNHAEEVVLSEDTFVLLCQHMPQWTEEDLRHVLSPGMMPDTSAAARDERYSYLMRKVAQREASGRVETIIPLSSTRRVIDASTDVVARTVASLGASTNGQLISYDYHRSSLNRITSTDVFLAAWANNTTADVAGSFYVSNDDFIEFQDSEPTILMPFSGGNFTVEAALVWNGPQMDFTYYDVLQGQSQTITLQPGEPLVYGADSPLGELFLNLTLDNEVVGSSTYVDGVISGPIPGASVIAVYGGSWPTV